MKYGLLAGVVILALAGGGYYYYQQQQGLQQERRGLLSYDEEITQRQGERSEEFRNVQQREDFPPAPAPSDAREEADETALLNNEDMSDEDSGGTPLDAGEQTGPPGEIADPEALDQEVYVSDLPDADIQAIDLDEELKAFLDKINATVLDYYEQRNILADQMEIRELLARSESPDVQDKMRMLMTELDEELREIRGRLDRFEGDIYQKAQKLQAEAETEIQRRWETLKQEDYLTYREFLSREGELLRAYSNLQRFIVQNVEAAEFNADENRLSFNEEALQDEFDQIVSTLQSLQQEQEQTVAKINSDTGGDE